VLYDAKGTSTEILIGGRNLQHRLVEPQLPFENGRSDLLTGSGSRLDIQNINLLATLFVHAQYQGYWNQLGMQFQERWKHAKRHVLNGLVDAPWVRTMIQRATTTTGSLPLFKSLWRTLLKRVSVSRRKVVSFRLHEIPVRASRGILQECSSWLQKYRSS